MKKLLALSTLALAMTTSTIAQDATVSIYADRGQQKIYKEISGQFAEHLGTCI